MTGLRLGLCTLLALNTCVSDSGNKQGWFEQILSLPVENHLVHRIAMNDPSSATKRQPSPTSAGKIRPSFARCRMIATGKQQSCDSHRGISLLFRLDHRQSPPQPLVQHLEQGHLPDRHGGFHGGRGTENMIFAYRQFHEKCKEQKRDLYDSDIIN